MSNCILCSKELNIMNKPPFGSGKLSDGNEVCMSCYSMISKKYPEIFSHLKKRTKSEIQSHIQEKQIRIDKIKSEIQNLNLDNISSFWGKKEIEELPNIIAENEHIDNLIQGTYNNGNGILVSTNRRLIFVDKGLGLKVEDFPLDKISSIQYEVGLALGKVKIHTSGNVATIINVNKVLAMKFSEFVRDKISNLSNKPNAINIQPTVLDQLEKLAVLKDKGILSEEEFIEQKKKILQNI